MCGTEKRIFDWNPASPESLGISSEDLAEFIRYLQKREKTIHSMIILRYGRPVLELYYRPWKREDLQRLYSSSKSFAAIAMLFLIDEGKAALDDPICRYFPEYDPETLHPWTRRATIYDALTMQLCFNAPPYAIANDENWISAFFRVKPDHPPGLIFYYDTSAAQMLAEIVKRVSGKPFYAYLKERVGIEGYLENACCIQAPDGSEFAGSGLRCTARDFALTAELLTAGGKICGKQLLSEKLAADAVRPHSVNNVDGNSTMSAAGYGYQIWCGEDCFMFKGMATQFAIGFPEKNLTFVVNSNTRGDGAAYEIVYTGLKNYVLSGMKDEPLPANPTAERALGRLTDQLTAAVQSGEKHAALEKEIAHKTWKLSGNIPGISEFRLSFEENEGIMQYRNQWGDHEIRFGYGERVPFLFREHHDIDRYVGTSPAEAYTCYGIGHFTRADQLRIKVEFEGMFMGHMEITLGFRGDEAAVYVHHDIDFYPDHWFLKYYSGFDGAIAEN